MIPFKMNEPCLLCKHRLLAVLFTENCYGKKLEKISCFFEKIA